VGSFAPNAFGLYDMHGNVAEWCVDNGDALWVEAVKDPVRLNNVKGPRIFRGGSFLSTAAQSTSYHRDAKIHDQPSTDNGFRVVCVVGPPDQLTKDILKHMAEAADPNTSKALGIRNEIARLTKSYNESGSMYDLLHRSEKYIDLADVCDTPTETLQLALIDVKLGLNRRSTFDEATQKSGYLWFRTEAEIRRKLADHFARLGRGDDAKREVEAALLATENALSDFTRYDRADLGPSVDAFGNKRPDASYRNYVQLYQQRAELYCQLNDYSNAIKELTKAIEYDTTSSRRYLERGQAYLKVNDYRKAAEDFNASLDLVDKGTNPAARSADILEEQKAILQLQRETYKKMGDDAKVVVIDESLARVEQQLADTKR